MEDLHGKRAQDARVTGGGVPTAVATIFRILRAVV
jgi:hypothetical protein